MNKSHSTCSIVVIDRFLDNSLDVDEQSTFEQHLDDCEACCCLLQERTAAAEQWANVAGTLSTADDLSPQDVSEPQTFDYVLDFLDPTDDPHMLGRFAGYEIIGVIGSGGMGMVMKGFDRALNRFVAIKILLPHYASSGAARKRFAREARAAAAVVHENVVAIHGVSAPPAMAGGSETPAAEEIGRHARLPFLVMPYLRGESLQKRIDRCGPLPTEEVLRISIQIASGLAAAHEQGLVHRDIKPANILLPESVDRVKITDFGLARAADDASLTRTGVIAGTPQYMSPQQALGESVSEQSDLFSLGSVMYAMCTGRAPFRAETSLGVLRRIVDEKARPIREVNPSIPQWLCEFISRLHEKSPENRPQDAESVAANLKDYLAHLQQPIAMPLPPKATSQPLDSTKASSGLNSLFYFTTQKGVITVIATITIALLGVFFWPATQQPEDSNASKTLTTELDSQKVKPHYQKKFVLSFANPAEIGELNVDIKRGDIIVAGHDGKDVLVTLTIPNLEAESKEANDGLSPIRASNPDFDITESGNSIKIDSNANQYTTDLEIKVPWETNLILDSYWDGVIKVDGVSGELNVRSQNNDISLNSVSGSARVWSYNGNFVASFDSVTEGRPLYFESYNGSMDISLPANICVTTKLRASMGELLTDFDIEIQQEPDLQIDQGNGEKVQKFDEFVNGQINGGGPLLTIETEKGDVRLRKRDLAVEHPTPNQDMPPLAIDNLSSNSDSWGPDEINRQKKTFDAILAFVEKDQMPEYLRHAAHAGWLEAKREYAIKQLDFDQAYQLEAQLMLDYEKAIQSYEAMMNNEVWQRRFSDMDLKDTAAYRRRLNYLKNELAERQKRNASESGSDQK